MAIHRGELYSYTSVLPPRPGQSTKRLVITVDRLNDAQPSLAVGLLVNDDDPGGLLTVRVGDRGWVSPVRIERLLISRLGELLYVATDEELDQIAVAMRAAYDL